MQIFRYIFGGLLVVGGLGAAYLTILALGVQSSWSRAANTARAAVLEAERGNAGQPSLAELGAQERLARSDLRAADVNFGRVLPAANPAFDAAGNLQVPVGTQDGLPPGGGGASTVVHVFAPTGNGAETLYVGPFTVTQAAERQAQLAPAFAVQPGEAQTWPVGFGDWRLRVDVPSSRAGRFGSLDMNLVAQRELLGNRRNTLETRRRSVAEARDTLAAREAELLGNPDAPEIPDAPEVRAGLAATITAEDLDRAAGLAELDRLRRAVKNASDRLREALEENRALSDRLPTEPPPRTARGR